MDTAIRLLRRLHVSTAPRPRATHTLGGGHRTTHATAIAGASSQYSCAVTGDQGVWTGERLEMQH
jgi:hypothetical protein